MKSAFPLLLMAILHHGSFAQAYPCEASDSVLAMYRDDADRMALTKTFQDGSTWMDSVVIDTALAHTALSALVAVYNSSSPQRDTVVGLLDIHIYPLIPLRSLVLSTDSSLDWVHQLVAGNIPTGNTALDELLDRYDVIDVEPWTWPIDDSQYFTITTGTNWNLLPLMHLFEQLMGVNYCATNGTIGDGDRIAASVYTDHVEVTYSYGWGDCPAGCGGFYHWVFNVYPDCSVEFMFGYGQSPFTTVHVAETLEPSLTAWPNPVSTVLHLKGRKLDGPLALYGIDGRPLGPPERVDQGIDVHKLPTGIYLLRHADRPDVPPLRFVVVH
ncbi:MAG: T9SS type A sorting domain-containing protein [Bacteroidetes bacterium]|nr:T9SS type A sorting domain-containing protein [Bacteroidota bacterium]